MYSLIPTPVIISSKIQRLTLTSYPQVTVAMLLQEWRGPCKDGVGSTRRFDLHNNNENFLLTTVNQFHNAHTEN